MKVVYVAGPFRAKSKYCLLYGPDGTVIDAHWDSWEIEQNIRRAETLALGVWRAGAAAICPHTNTRFYQGAAPDNVWLEGDLAILAKCDAVLMTHDWTRSSGARAEHEYAKERNIPVFYSLDSLEEWLRGPEDSVK